MKVWWMLPFFLMACQPSLSRQPKNTALSKSDFFADGASARPLPEGVVPFQAGGLSRPLPLNPASLAAGQQLFEIHCTICHGSAGDGQSVAVARGFPTVPSLATEKTLAHSDADLYKAVSEGDGKMFGFGDRLSPREIQALVHYVRALQLSLHAPYASLPASDQAQLNALVQKGKQP